MIEIDNKVQDDQEKHQHKITEFLWKVIGRFDYYIGATNAKAAGLITFNTFVFTGVVLKFNDLMPISEPKWQINLSAISLMIAALAAFISLSTIFWSLYPFTSSSDNGKHYRSNIFFAHISSLKSSTEYFELIEKSATVEINKDLAAQAHSLSNALTRKFSFIQVATKAVAFELVAILLAIGLKFYSIFHNIIPN
jgi:hypothetical protein